MSATKANRKPGANKLKANSPKPAVGIALQTVPPGQRDRVALRLRNASKDFQAGRFGDADKSLSNLMRSYPKEPELLELFGLTQYRLGHWEKAVGALEALLELAGGGAKTGVSSASALSNSSLLPIMADCYRALGDTDQVRSLWEQLRAASSDADAMTEGRIVMAGALADAGDLAAAIRLLERGPVKASIVRDRHLRIWYALADLYDQAGETQRARRGFSRIVEVDADYFDAAQRLKALSEAD